MKILEKNNLNEIINNGIWIVDFYADWCGPCKMLTPVLESLNYENILKVNVDNNRELSNSFGIMSIPTLIFFKDGEVKNKIIGFTTKEEIENILENLNKN